ncbi:MAG: helix-turn-helix transcriptional regulator [Verrucomicrobiota bacterium]|jgi:transcriptional regulator with XRE-family HTH domain
MPQRDATLSQFGQNVRRFREAKGLSQEALAELAGLDRTYVSDIERGRRNLGIKNVARLAKALGCTTGELCKGVGA